MAFEFTQRTVVALAWDYAIGAVVHLAGVATGHVDALALAGTLVGAAMESPCGHPAFFRQSLCAGGPHEHSA